MKWPRWIPRLLMEPVPSFTETRRRVRFATPATAERLGIRDVGQCEACGRPMQSRTRRREFRGRVDCDCGFRNHVEFRDVRSGEGVIGRHVTLTTGREFEEATHRPDLRLAWRYGVCPSCSMAMRLVDACVISQEDNDGAVERLSYYCSSCHLGDVMHRGRLLGHDGNHIVDTLRFQLPQGAH